MKRKQSEYGINGVIIGLLIGSIAGFFFLNQIKKGQKGVMLPIAIATGGLIGVISGYKIGSNLGKDAYIDDKLGFNHKSEGYNKDGKYWYGITKWLDKRDNKEYTLLTGRSNSGELVSALNDATIINHQIRNANQQTVPNHHVKARNYVFKKLRENFKEEGVKDLKALFPIL